ncbi:sensor histidine kinase [Haliangium ochraceum]|uniref:histidine kinase n=1 Tax=Haliangium ochraceum (strain DSM 14365 / JCM 11303 / SMP-2) TaxID=502025 RepID=D0LRM4_HALO1|nr:response regulator [Haliangium ochraceum]ACY19016.1 response regulator receiver sensor signal transduction histidine kinase [Haliangium ochraceum DSM 14365]
MSNEASHRDSPSPESAPSEAVVLLVDDNPANLAVLFEHLDEHGYRVLVAEDGSEAVELASRIQPDIILLDVMMPGIDGFETCRQLKSHSTLSDIPIIFMTALTDTRDKVEGFRAGAVDYVTKPFQHREVLARVRTHVVLRRLDAELRDQKRVLEAEVQERLAAEAALKQHVAMLEAQNAELDAFARTVAHNLKDPLNGVLGFADLVVNEFTLEEDAERYLTHIVESARRMNDITEELLLLARLRASDVGREKLDMKSIVRRSRERLTPMLESNRAEIVLGSEWPRAMGYAPWVEEVWVNYLSNAVKYGGKPPRIELGATPLEDGFVRHWVRDNGAGIAPEARPHLFTEFTRLGQVNVRGYGLGLSIVKRIVDKLGGRVGVDSNTGEGSMFYFDLATT